MHTVASRTENGNTEPERRQRRSRIVTARGYPGFRLPKLRNYACEHASKCCCPERPFEQQHPQATTHTHATTHTSNSTHTSNDTHNNSQALLVAQKLNLTLVCPLPPPATHPRPRRTWDERRGRGSTRSKASLFADRPAEPGARSLQPDLAHLRRRWSTTCNQDYSLCHLG